MVVLTKRMDMAGVNSFFQEVVEAGKGRVLSGFQEEGETGSGWSEGASR